MWKSINTVIGIQIIKLLNFFQILIITIGIVCENLQTILLNMEVYLPISLTKGIYFLINLFKCKCFLVS